MIYGTKAFLAVLTALGLLAYAPMPLQGAERRNSPFGIHGAGMTFLGEAGDLNASIVRIIISGPIWRKIEEAGDLDFTILDHVVSALQRHAMDLVITLDANSEVWGAHSVLDKKPNANDPTVHSDTPSNAGLYARTVRSIAERYDHDGIDDMPGLAYSVDYYQIVNEWVWQWEGSKESYLDHLKTSREILASAHPGVRIILGGLTMVEHLAIVEGVRPDATLKIGGMLGRDAPVVVTLEQIKRRMPAVYEKSIGRLKFILAEGRAYYDIVDLHDYSETCAEMIPSINVLKKLAPDKDIWSLENAGPFYRYSSEKHSEELVKRYVVGLSHGIKKLFWSSYHPTGGWPRNFLNLSLVDVKQGSELKKPAWYTYQFLARSMEGVRSVTRLELASGVEVYKAECGSQDLYVLWSEDGQRSISLPWPDPAKDVRAVTLKVYDSRITQDLVPFVIQDHVLRISASSCPVFVGSSIPPQNRAATTDL